MDLKKKTFSGFIWLFAGSSSQTVFQILVTTILARLISPDDFGVVAIGTVFIGFSKIFSQLGMGAAIVQRREISTSHIRTAFSISLFLGIFFCLITVMLSNHIALYFEMTELSTVLKMVSIIFIIDSFVSVSQAIIQRKLKMKYYALTELISYLIAFGGLGVTLAFLNYGMYALVYASILQAILRAIMVSYLEPHSVIPFFKKESFYDLFFFASGQTFAKIANYFAGEGDNLVVGKMLSADALGNYSQAYKLMVAPVRLIGQSLNIILFPVLASVQRDRTRVRRAYYRSIQFVAYTSLIISVVLFVNAEEIVLILLGSEWLQVVIPFQILAIGTIFRMSYKVSDSLIKALGDVYKRAIIQFGYAISVLLFSYIGHFWGIEGVAIGVLISIILNFISMTYLSLLQFKDNGREFIKLHFKPIMLAFVVFVFSYFVLHFLRTLNLNLILLEIIYIVLVFGFVMFVMIKFKEPLGISNEINAILQKLAQRKK